MLTRRTFVFSNLHVLATLASGSWLVSCTDTDTAAPQPPGPPKSLREYASRMQAISFVGPTCRQQIQELNRFADSVLTGSLERLIQGRIAETDGGLPLTERIGLLIRADFASDRTVDIHGWRLSQTECELSALAASIEGLSEPVPPGIKALETGHFLDVANWGPRETEQGVPFNQQPDGHSGLWFKAENAPAATMVIFGDTRLPTQIYPDSFTSGIRGKFMEEVLSTPGEYPVKIYDKARQIVQPLGTFTVRKQIATSPDETEFDYGSCTVHSWGPRRGDHGERFNPQPNGESAFWIKTDCSFRDAEMLLDGQALKTTVHDGLITAVVANGEKLKKSDYALAVRFPGSGHVMPVGVFTIE